MTITATFRDGPLAGTSVEVDLEQHRYVDRKTGAEYLRFTEYVGNDVRSYFVLRETAYGTLRAINAKPKTEPFN